MQVCLGSEALEQFGVRRRSWQPEELCCVDGRLDQPTKAGNDFAQALPRR
jgi:hypothetical protein